MCTFKLNYSSNYYNVKYSKVITLLGMQSLNNVIKLKLIYALCCKMDFVHKT